MHGIEVYFGVPFVSKPIYYKLHSNFFYKTMIDHHGHLGDI